VPASEAGAVTAPGRVEPISDEIDVAAELSGRLAAVLVDEGEEIAAGQEIARLVRDDHQARLDAARARLGIAEAEHDRLINGARPEERRAAAAVRDQAGATLSHALTQVERSRTLFSEGVIARDELDRAERDWRVAVARHAETQENAIVVDADARADERRRTEANVTLARAQVAEAEAVLAKTIVRAPIAGIVLRRHKESGENVSVESGSPAIVTIADTRVLRVRMDLDERDIARVRVGDAAWVTADAYGDRRFAGRVVRVGQILGRKTVRTDAPTERVDTKVLETLIELEAGASLPIGLRVDAFVKGR
jgi:HlyD family secretion protein